MINGQSMGILVIYEVTRPFKLLMNVQIQSCSPHQIETNASEIIHELKLRQQYYASSKNASAVIFVFKIFQVSKSRPPKLPECPANGLDRVNPYGLMVQSQIKRRKKSMKPWELRKPSNVRRIWGMINCENCLVGQPRSF